MLANARQEVSFIYALTQFYECASYFSKFRVRPRYNGASLDARQHVNNSFYLTWVDVVASRFEHLACPTDQLKKPVTPRPSNISSPMPTILCESSSGRFLIV